MATVFVGLSGGVDSAVSAAILKERGHKVVGAFIKIWSPEFLECTWKEDRLDAMRVCAALNIPFLEVDLSEQYKREVVADMISKYARGFTPNPDVLCNRSIKFGHFAAWAFEKGADMLATGHYARVRKQQGAFELLRGVDQSKDQSYFLHELNQSDLSRILFPVGELEKARVRALAQRFGLPNANRRDSQGLCFVGDVSIKDFLARFIELTPGDVLNEKGDVVGRHDGAALYTIGERHGFLAAGSTAHFVTETDVERNSVRVSTQRGNAARSSVALSAVHWIGESPMLPITAQTQARYRERPLATTISEEKGTSIASFAEPRIAAAGQSLVFYREEICLGGAIINNRSN